MTNQTARDLRTAAQLIRDRGRCTGQLIRNDTGSLCLLGAIGVATETVAIQTRNMEGSDLEVHWLVPIGSLRGKATAEQVMMIQESYMNSSLRNAVRAVGEILPDTLDPEGPLESGSVLMDRVWRFNDSVCTGTEDAALLLEQAAEKIEANL